jgi:hypothetical protein
MVRMIELPERVAQGIAERVVALVVDALDPDALLARVDVNALLDRVDVARLVDRVDVNTLLNRVDIDALLSRVDVEQLVARIDLSTTMTTTATSAAEDAVHALRGVAARGDQATARLADRLVGRG